MSRLLSPNTRDRIEVAIFDVALILVGIFTLPATAGLAAGVTTGWRAALVQAVLLFVIRITARYAWRRMWRRFDNRSKP